MKNILKLTCVLTGLLLAQPALAATTLYIKQVVNVEHTAGRISEDFGQIVVSMAGGTGHTYIYMVGNGTADVSLGVNPPVFPLDYSVDPGSDPRGIFVPTLDSGCSGIVQKDEQKTCFITWRDTPKKTTTTTQNTAQPAPTSTTPTTTANTGTPSVPIPTGIPATNHSGLSAVQVAAIVGLLRAFGVDEASVSTVYAILTQ